MLQVDRHCALEPTWGNIIVERLCLRWECQGMIEHAYLRWWPHGWCCLFFHYYFICLIYYLEALKATHIYWSPSLSVLHIPWGSPSLNAIQRNHFLHCQHFPEPSQLLTFKCSRLVKTMIVCMVLQLDPVTLQPGETWSAQQFLALAPFPCDRISLRG